MGVAASKRGSNGTMVLSLVKLLICSRKWYQRRQENWKEIKEQDQANIVIGMMRTPTCQRQLCRSTRVKEANQTSPPSVAVGRNMIPCSFMWRLWAYGRYFAQQLMRHWDAPANRTWSKAAMAYGYYVECHQIWQIWILASKRAGKLLVMPLDQVGLHVQNRITLLQAVMLM